MQEQKPRLARIRGSHFRGFGRWNVVWSEWRLGIPEYVHTKWCSCRTKCAQRKGVKQGKRASIRMTLSATAETLCGVPLPSHVVDRWEEFDRYDGKNSMRSVIRFQQSLRDVKRPDLGC